MDEIVEIVRKIGQQQGENIYYRACHALFKRLQELVEDSSEELHRVYHSGSFEAGNNPFSPVYHITTELRGAIYELLEQACEEICPVNPNTAASEIFRPLLANADSR